MSVRHYQGNLSHVLIHDGTHQFPRRGLFFILICLLFIFLLFSLFFSPLISLLFFFSFLLSSFAFSFFSSTVLYFFLLFVKKNIFSYSGCYVGENLVVLDVRGVVRLDPDRAGCTARPRLFLISKLLKSTKMKIDFERHKADAIFSVQ